MKRFIKSMIVAVLILSLLPCNEVTAAEMVTKVWGTGQYSNARTSQYLLELENADFQRYIPGLKQTVTADINGDISLCYSMTPQGFTMTDKYILISAYCGCGNHNSVIYIIDKNTKQYMSTYILDTNCHVGGIAVCSNYLWVCDSSNDGYPRLRAYLYSDLDISVNTDYTKGRTQSVQYVDTKPSFLCSNNEKLYVGTFYEIKSSCKIYFYSVNSKKITKQGYITIKGANKIQGISIRNNYMVITSSYGVHKNSTVRVYKDDNYGFEKSGIVYNNPIYTSEELLPFMVEGCYIDSDKTYFVFESAAAKYRNYGFMRMDRYLGYNNSRLNIK